MNVKRVFLTLVLFFILALILVTGLLFAETVFVAYLALILAGTACIISMPLLDQVSVILSTRQRE